MTYVVTDACIKCKYLDCMKVCAIDCFYEAQNMLVIRPEKCLECEVCAVECTVDAIPQNNEGDLERRLKLGAQHARIWPNISAKEEIPAGANYWAGVICNFEFFNAKPESGM